MWVMVTIGCMERTDRHRVWDERVHLALHDDEGVEPAISRVLDAYSARITGMLQAALEAGVRQVDTWCVSGVWEAYHRWTYDGKAWQMVMV